jgi:hypothetical protein
VKQFPIMLFLNGRKYEIYSCSKNKNNNNNIIILMTKPSRNCLGFSE